MNLRPTAPFGAVNRRYVNYATDRSKVSRFLARYFEIVCPCCGALIPSDTLSVANRSSPFSLMSLALKRKYRHVRNSGFEHCQSLRNASEVLAGNFAQLMWILRSVIASMREMVTWGGSTGLPFSGQGDLHFESH